MSWLKHVGFAIGLALMAAGSAMAQSAGAAPGCPAPVIEIRKAAIEARVDRSLSLWALAARARGLDSGPTGEGTLAGLYEPETSLGINFDTAPISSFEHCVTRLSVTVEMRPVIFIASDIPERSCAGAAALAHEREHDQAAPMDAARALERAARANPPAPGVLVAKDEAQARQEALRWVIPYAKGLSEAMSQGLMEAAQALDDPASYQRVAAACQGEESLAAVIRRAKAAGLMAKASAP